MRDHRGVPGAPGRVVTLVPEAASRCWGMAYRVSGPAERVLEELDHRERGGYRRLEVAIRTSAPERRIEGAFTWVAEPDNPNYLGPAPAPQIAAQVRRSRAPSGANREYVLRLAEALRDMEAEDPHVFELEDLLR